MKNLVALILLAAALVLTAQADPVVVSGNTIGDLVNVNVNIEAEIRNDIHQHYYQGREAETTKEFQVIWDHIQDVIGRLNLRPTQELDGPAEEVEVEEEIKRPDGRPEVGKEEPMEQLLTMLTGNPEVWKQLARKMSPEKLSE